MEYRPGLHRFALLLACCTLLLVVAGAMVTSKDAGLSVPDWPLSYGRLMPPMEGNIFYEHGHRMVATAVGMLSIVMAVWLWRSPAPRWLKMTGLAAVGGVIAQGVLGGITVLWMLPPAISSSHACLAELFFSTTVAIALFTSRAWQKGPATVEDRGLLPLRTVAVFLPVFVLFQVALGATARHKAIGSVYHIANSALVTAAVLYVTLRILLHYARHDALRQSAIGMLVVTLVQVFLGIAAYMSRIATVDAVQPMPVMVTFTVMHVAVGALTMAASVVLAIQVCRNVRRHAPQPQTSARYVTVS
jgi:cytochrome c oxidase assembly protein subunit 15